MTTTAFDVASTVRTERKGNLFLDYLVHTDLSKDRHIPCYKSVFSVQASDSLPYAFGQLSKKGFLSCPVLEGTTYKGFLSLYDITVYVTNMFWGETADSWHDYFTKSEDFANTTIRDVMDAPTWRGQQTASTQLCEYNTTLFALETLAMDGAKRACVMNNKFQKNVVNIMTQSMLISEIRQRMSMLGTVLRNKPVRDLTSYWQTPIKIKDTELAINAFNKMTTNNVQGLAIVDDDNVLQGAMSVRDLRGIGSDGEYFSKLFTTVRDFKAFARMKYPKLGAQGHYEQGKIPRKGLYLLADSATFEDVINAMADGSLHRVFICELNDMGLPVPFKVVTQTDVLKVVLKHFTIPAKTLY